MQSYVVGYAAGFRGAASLVLWLQLVRTVILAAPVPYVAFNSLTGCRLQLVLNGRQMNDAVVVQRS